MQHPSRNDKHSLQEKSDSKAEGRILLACAEALALCLAAGKLLGKLSGSLGFQSLLAQCLQPFSLLLARLAAGLGQKCPSSCLG